MWWRVFIPSFRFFDQPGAAPRLWARLPASVPGDWPWEEVLEKPPTELTDFLINPDGNLYHARMNLLERLVMELDPAQPTRQLVSYKLVEDIVKEWAENRGAKGADFKITSHDQDVLLSRYREPAENGTENQTKNGTANGTETKTATVTDTGISQA